MTSDSEFEPATENSASPADGPAAEQLDAVPPAEEDRSGRRGNALWAVLAVLLLLAIVVLLLLTRCTPRVPDVVGMNRKLAEQTLREAGYKTGDVSLIAQSKKKVGEVVGQAPEGGNYLPKGEPVDLIVIKGSDMVRVPDVLGNNTPAAKVALDAKGLGMKPTSVYSETVPVGAVVSQAPLPGTLVRVDSAVAVSVSMGPVPITGGGSVPTNAATGGGTSSSSGSGQVTQYVPNPGCNTAYPGASVWSSGGDIYARLTPGGSTRKLTSGSPWDTDPILAPSSKYVVFKRATASGQPATKIGRVCFTDFGVKMLSLSDPGFGSSTRYWYTDYRFAPSPTGTAPDSDWLIIAQMFEPDPAISPGEPSGRILACSVPIDSTWASWNVAFRPTSTLTFSRGTAAGTITVHSTRLPSVAFNPYTQLYGTH